MRIMGFIQQHGYVWVLREPSVISHSVATFRQAV